MNAVTVHGAGTTAVNGRFTERSPKVAGFYKRTFRSESGYGLHYTIAYSGCPEGWWITTPDTGSVPSSDFGIYFNPSSNSLEIPRTGWCIYSGTWAAVGQEIPGGRAPPGELPLPSLQIDGSPIASTTVATRYISAIVGALGAIRVVARACIVRNVQQRRDSSAPHRHSRSALPFRLLLRQARNCRYFGLFLLCSNEEAMMELYRAEFDKLDLDGSGTIDARELKQAMIERRTRMRKRKQN